MGYSLIGPFDSNNKFDLPRVTSVDFHLPDEYSWKNIWNVVLESRLDALLRAWDKANQNASELHFTIKLTSEDLVLKWKTIRQGEGFLKKPKLGRVDWKDEKGSPTESYIWNDKVYERYDFEKKEKQVFQVPAESAREHLNWIGRFLLSIFEERIEWLWFNLTAPEVKERFEISLLKEDTNWAYLQLKPIKKVDQNYFRPIRAVLNQKTHLIRQVYLVDVNGNRHIWDYETIDVNPTPPLTTQSIFKGLPKEFKEIRIPYSGTEIDAKASDSKSRKQ